MIPLNSISVRPIKDVPIGELFLTGSGEIRDLHLRIEDDQGTPASVQFSRVPSLRSLMVLHPAPNNCVALGTKPEMYALKIDTSLSDKRPEHGTYISVAGNEHSVAVARQEQNGAIVFISINEWKIMQPGTDAAYLTNWQLSLRGSDEMLYPLITFNYE